MMTSMGGNRARGSWEQTPGPAQSQTQHKQRPQVPSPSITIHHLHTWAVMILRYIYV